MSILNAKNSIRKRVALGAACVALAIAGTSPAFAVTGTTLTAEQQADVTALVAKLLDLAKNLSATSSEGTFEGAFADALSGYSAAVIKAAMDQVAGTPGIPSNAVAAAQRLSRSYASTGTGGGTGAVGGQGGLASGSGPGFTSGGGGSNYSQ
jgi:hypothetical protein